MRRGRRRLSCRAVHGKDGVRRGCADNSSVTRRPPRAGPRAPGPASAVRQCRRSPTRCSRGAGPRGAPTRGHGREAAATNALSRRGRASAARACRPYGSRRTANSLPSATTTRAAGVTTNGATLNDTVNPNGVPTSYHFVYGKSTAYGSTTPSQSARSGTSSQSVSNAVSGPAPGTTYHFQLVATNALGRTTEAGDVAFTTSSPTPHPPAPRLPLPIAGVSVNVVPLAAGGVRPAAGRRETSPRRRRARPDPVADRRNGWPRRDRGGSVRPQPHDLGQPRADLLRASALTRPAAARPVIWRTGRIALRPKLA